MEAHFPMIQVSLKISAADLSPRPGQTTPVHQLYRKYCHKASAIGEIGPNFHFTFILYFLLLCIQLFSYFPQFLFFNFSLLLFFIFIYTYNFVFILLGFFVCFHFISFCFAFSFLSLLFSFLEKIMRQTNSPQKKEQAIELMTRDLISRDISKMSELEFKTMNKNTIWGSGRFRREDGGI